jgi:hypothetical protein
VHKDDQSRIGAVAGGTAQVPDGDPRIAVGTFGVPDDAIALNPQTLQPGEDKIVLEALTALLSSRNGE